MLKDDLKKLKEMSIEKQLTFCYLTSERLFPIYRYFVENYHFGDSRLLRKGIDLVYDNIFSVEKVNDIIVDTLLENILINIPHTDDFETFYATLAVDSGGAIYETINLLKKKDISRIIDDVSSYPFNAIDCYIQVRDDMDYNDKDFESKISNDPLMRTERSVQEGIISYLDKVKLLDESDLRNLIQLQGNNKSAILL